MGRKHNPNKINPEETHHFISFCEIKCYTQKRYPRPVDIKAFARHINESANHFRIMINSHGLSNRNYVNRETGVNLLADETSSEFTDYLNAMTDQFNDISDDGTIITFNIINS